MADEPTISAPAAPSATPAPAAPAPAAAERDEEGWSDDGEGGGGSGASEDAKSIDAAVGGQTTDDKGALPGGWTVQHDEEGDAWYYNATTGETSWVRPNPDGTIPPV